MTKIYEYTIRKIALVLIDRTCHRLSYRVILAWNNKLPQTKKKSASFLKNTIDAVFYISTELYIF